MNLVDFPKEILFQIMYKLSYTDILMLCSLAKTFNDICHNSYFWGKKIDHDFAIRLKPNIKNITSESYLAFATDFGEAYIGSESYAPRLNLLSIAYLKGDKDLLNYFAWKDFEDSDYDVKTVNRYFGFNPRVLGEGLVNLFTNSDLGNACLTVQTGPRSEEVIDEEGNNHIVDLPEVEYRPVPNPLKDFLKLALNPPYIINNIALMPLLRIYFKNTDFFSEDFIGYETPSEMKHYLSSVFSAIKIDNPKFNEDLLTEGDLVMIILYGTVNKNELSQETRLMMAELKIKARIKFEQSIIESTMTGECWNK